MIRRPFPNKFTTPPASPKISMGTYEITTGDASIETAGSRLVEVKQKGCSHTELSSQVPRTPARSMAKREKLEALQSSPVLLWELPPEDTQAVVPSSQVATFQAHVKQSCCFVVS